MSRSIRESMRLPVPPAEAFALLHTPSAVRRWWGASRVVVIPRTGGAWIAAWGESEDHPDYVSAARISDFSPPHRLTLTDFLYQAPEPLPFDAGDLTTEFAVEAAEGGSRLTVVQRGFPDDEAADAFFAACRRGWTATFEGIGRFVREGR